MPTPKKGERKKKFIKRCIPDIYKEEGTLTSKDKKNKQSYAICNSIFDRRNKKKKNENIKSFSEYNENIEWESWDDEFDHSDKKSRIKKLKTLIFIWDKLSKNNPNNIHNLSTSKRQDWVDELIQLEDNSNENIEWESWDDEDLEGNDFDKEYDRLKQILNKVNKHDRLFIKFAYGAVERGFVSMDTLEKFISWENINPKEVMDFFKDKPNNIIKKTILGYLVLNLPKPKINESVEQLQKMVSKEYGVGKKMGNDIYVHKKYEYLLPQNSLNHAKRMLTEKGVDDFDYTIVKYNQRDHSISFIKSSDFDTADEPTVDDSYRVVGDIVKYKPKMKRDQIYHHKWMFVKPDYDGFDYDESVKRSMQWFKKYDYNSSKIGWKDYWDELSFNENYTEEEIEIANKTSRTSKNPGAVGGRAVVPEFVERLACAGDLILDFGSGKYPLYTFRLREKGYNVKAYDFGNNFNPEYHDGDALNYKYNVVFASNVLNVQSSILMLKHTLEQIKNLLEDNGIFIANYPSIPRKMGLSYKEIREIVSEYFDVRDLGKTTMMMTNKKQINESNFFQKDRVVNDYETFTMVIRNYDLTRGSVDEFQYNGSRSVDVRNLFYREETKKSPYTKPYEKRRLY